MDPISDAFVTVGREKRSLLQSKNRYTYVAYLAPSARMVYNWPTTPVLSEMLLVGK
jgi:hypothetical protein